MILQCGASPSSWIPLRMQPIGRSRPGCSIIFGSRHSQHGVEQSCSVSSPAGRCRAAPCRRLGPGLLAWESARPSRTVVSLVVLHSLSCRCGSGSGAAVASRSCSSCCRRSICTLSMRWSRISVLAMPNRGRRCGYGPLCCFSAWWPPPCAGWAECCLKDGYPQRSPSRNPARLSTVSTGLDGSGAGVATRPPPRRRTGSETPRSAIVVAQSNTMTLRATSPAFIASNAPLTWSRRTRRVIISSRCSLPAR